MDEESYEENLALQIEKLKKVQKEYVGTREQVIETLEKLKKTQKDYIQLVKEHTEYWNNELEKTKYEDTARREKLKKTLRNEEKIFKKLEKGLKHTNERIEFHKKHNVY